MFGRGYEEIGDSQKGLILKNSGKVKILWGNKFIDLLDSNGNLNVKVQSLIKKVSSELDMKQDGFYYLNDGLVAKIGDNILEVASDSGTVYVSFLQELETTNELKYTALKNIGFVYKDINKLNIYPKNGIIYIENELALYIVNEGQLSKYVAQIPNPFTEQFIIRKNEDLYSSEGALIIEGEGVSNSLKFNTLKIYSEGYNSILKSDREFQFNINNNRVVTMNQAGLYSNGILSYDASDTYGYRIQQSNGKYVLDIDKINVREPIDVEFEKYNIPLRIYNKENIILSTRPIYNETNVFVKYRFNLKYINEYLVGDVIKTYLEVSENDYKKLIVPISITITEVSPLNSEENYVCATSITPLIQTEESITDIYNSHCFLFKRLVNNELKNNLDLIIGELDLSDRYKTDQNNLISNGIISKLNIFYSAKFDKEGTGNLIFPFYTQALYNLLETELYDETTLKSNYKKENYKYVIPPILVVNNIANGILNPLLKDINDKNPQYPATGTYLYFNGTTYLWVRILGELLLDLNENGSVPISNGYLYYNNSTGKYEWNSGVLLGALLTALNSVSVPSSEGYLHYDGSDYDWQIPSGGGGNNLDLFDTLVILNKNNELTVTLTYKEVKAYLGRTTINGINSSTVWDISSNNSISFDPERGIGNSSFVVYHGLNNTFNNIQNTILIKDIFYDRLKELYPNDSSVNKHIKTITLVQLAKKTLSVLSGDDDLEWDTTLVPIVLNSSFNKSGNITTDADSWCTIGTVIRNPDKETLSFTAQLTLNTSTSNRTVNITVKTTDGQSLTFSITLKKKPENT